MPDFTDKLFILLNTHGQQNKTGLVIRIVTLRMQVKNRGGNVEEILNRNINIIITHDCTVILGSTEPVKCQKPKTKELFQYEICPYRSNYHACH